MRTYTWIMVEITLILLMGWWGIRSPNIKPLKQRIAMLDSTQTALRTKVDALAVGQQDSIMMIRREISAMRRAAEEALEQSDRALALARKREREVTELTAYQDRVIATLFYGRSDPILARGIQRFRERNTPDVVDSLWNQRLNSGSFRAGRPPASPYVEKEEIRPDRRKR